MAFLHLKLMILHIINDVKYEYTTDDDEDCRVINTRKKVKEDFDDFILIKKIGLIFKI